MAKIYQLRAIKFTMVPKILKVVPWTWFTGSRIFLTLNAATPLSYLIRRIPFIKMYFSNSDDTTAKLYMIVGLMQIKQSKVQIEEFTAVWSLWEKKSKKILSNFEEFITLSNLYLLRSIFWQTSLFCYYKRIL